MLSHNFIIEGSVGLPGEVIFNRFAFADDIVTVPDSAFLQIGNILAGNCYNATRVFNGQYVHHLKYGVRFCRGSPALVDDEFYIRVFYILVIQLI